MTTKIIALLAAIMFLMPVRAADAASLGMSVPVFIAHMGIAFERVTWGFSPERIKHSLMRTPDGNYAAEYSPEIFLYFYVEPGDENLNYIALSFSVETEAGLKSTDGESQYGSLCRQLIFALEDGATDETASRLLTDLGLFGLVLDGVQRAERSGKFTYMTRYCQSNIMLLIVPAL